MGNISWLTDEVRCKTAMIGINDSHELERQRIDAVRLDDAVNRAELSEVQALLDEGIDPNIKDVCGDPVIIGAAWIGASDVVRLLIAQGADVNAIGHDGKNALQRLLNHSGLWHNGHKQVVTLLRELGACD